LETDVAALKIPFKTYPIQYLGRFDIQLGSHFNQGRSKGQRLMNELITLQCD